MNRDNWDRQARRWEKKMDRWGDRFGRRMDGLAWNMFSGLLLVIMGVVFLLSNKGMIDVDYILRSGPAVIAIGICIIAVGIFKLTESGDHDQHSSATHESDREPRA